MGKKIHKLLTIAICLSAISLTGCLTTNFRSMGSIPLPTAHQPRLDPESKEAEKVVSFDGFGIINDSWENVEEIYGVGGSVSGTFRLGGSVSPLFVDFGISAYTGSTQFTCDVKKDCREEYLNWLNKSEEGKKDYSFFGLQEQARFGAEFQTPINLFLGLSAGMLVHQSGGDYSNKRKDLEKEIRGIKNTDDDIDFYPIYTIWIGYHIGKNGKYGSIYIDNQFSSKNSLSDSFILPTNIGYFHPTGFHGIVGLGKGPGVSVSLGKSFMF